MNSRPRLLVTASTYPRWHDDPEPGFVHELAKRLTDHFDVAVLAPHAAGAQTCEIMDGVQVYRYRYAPARSETLVNAGGIVTNLKHQPWKWLLVPLFLLSQFWNTWRLIRRWHPDVIHAHWLIPQGVLAAMLVAGRHRPVLVVTSHGADLFALRAAPLQALKRFVVGRAAAITVVSRTMRNELLKLGAESGKISVQPMGVDLQSRFVPDPGTVRSGSELLFVGRLVEKKGLTHLVAALPDILATCPEVILTVVGFGPDEGTLRQQVTNLGLNNKVRFIGAVAQDQLPALHRRAALFVAPFVQAASGDQEGLGLVAVEAAGCDCPVLIGNVPATADIPADRVDATDHAQLANAVTAILANPSRAVALAQERRRTCMEKFDWQMVADGYAKLLLRHTDFDTGQVSE